MRRSADRQPAGVPAREIPASVHEALRDPGSPLDPGVRRFMGRGGSAGAAVLGGAAGVLVGMLGGAIVDSASS